MAEVDKSEKITINIGLVDLGQIDLLVNEGFYANRTDFIRTAIRRQLETRSGAVDQTVARRTLTLGTQHYSRRDLEDFAPPAVRSNSASWGSRRSTTTSRPSSRWRRSRRWRSLGRFARHEAVKAGSGAQNCVSGGGGAVGWGVESARRGSQQAGGLDHERRLGMPPWPRHYD